MENGTDFPSEYNRPSFFKVMIGSYDTELLIPLLFVKMFQRFLPEKVVLRVSPSKLWIIDVVKENKKEWYFRTGWDRFVKENTLEVGEFLVFQFAGNSTFNVMIFGISACNKEVQMRNVRYSDVNAATENQKERIWTADAGKENQKERAAAADAGKENQKERISTAGAGKENLKERIRPVDARKENRKERIPTVDPGKENPKERIQPVDVRKENRKERIPTVDARKENPKERIQPTDARKENQQEIIASADAGKQNQNERIPTADVGKENLNERKPTTPENQPERKMEVVVQLKREKVDYNEDSKLNVFLNDVRFTQRDDKKCEEENDDEVIDIESDSDMDIGYHGRKIPTKRTFPDADVKAVSSNSKVTSSDAVEKRGSWNSNYSSFRSVMKQAYVERGILNLPTAFVREHLDHTKESEKIDIELETCKGTWVVKMIRHPKGTWAYGRFSAGWLDFVRDNDLRAGDTCYFELIRKDNPLFVVHVLRNDELLMVEGENF